MLTNWMFQSCTISSLEIKEIKIANDNKQAFVGQTLDLEAILNLSAPLTGIDVTVEPQGEKGWRFEQHFEEQLNKGTSIPLKKQINIPDTASVGKYIVAISAIQEDNQRAEKQIEVDFVIDSTVPILSPLDVGLNKAGNDLHLETEITAAKKIAKINVHIKGESWHESYDFTGQKFEGKLSLHFHEHIHVDDAPNGIYEITVTVEDGEGRTGTAIGSFEKNI